MTFPSIARRVILVADRRAETGPATRRPLRRYRLARLRLETSPAGSEPSFEYLKRVYD